MITLQHTPEDIALCTVNTDAQAQLGTSAAAGVAAVKQMSGCGSVAQTNYEVMALRHGR